MNPMKKRSAVVVAGILALVVALGACGNDDDDADGDGGGDGATEIDVTLSEFVVEPDSSLASAGEVTFSAENVGSDPHELVVARDGDASALPTDADGAVDEAALDPDQLIGEIEEFDPGNTEVGTFDLEPGSYVLFCNIVEEEDGEIESHFAEGMFTTFQVN